MWLTAWRSRWSSHSGHYLWFVIPEPHYSIYRDSGNIVARICLPQMRWEGQDEKIDAYARAVSGVLTLETDPRRREKYLDYVDTYAKLDEAERKLFEQRYPGESEKMVGVVSRARDEGRDEGRQEGEAQLFLWLLEDKFGAATAQRSINAVPAQINAR